MATPTHRLRRVVMRPITPAALISLSEELEREAEAIVDRLRARGRFCATRELATHLPVTIVSNASVFRRKDASG